MHTADAAAILEYLGAPPAVVVGTSAGATVAVDLAVRRPALVRMVVAHEAAWRATRHLPTVSQVVAVAKIGSLALRGRHGDAAEAVSRAAYSYRDGETAWDAFPEEWRRVARENARPALVDFRNSIGNYPTPKALATIKVPVVCTFGERSPDSIVRLTRLLAAAIPTVETRQIEGTGHAAPFDAPSNFRGADRRQHHLCEGLTFWVSARVPANVQNDVTQPPSWSTSPSPLPRMSAGP